MKKATNLAGFECNYMIEDPTAAIIARFPSYQETSSTDSPGKKYLVFDMGGEALAVSILKLSYGIWEIESSHTCSEISGNALDRLLYTFCIDNFKDENSIERLNVNKTAEKHLLYECEQAKVKLSTNEQAKITVCNLVDGKNLSQTIS